MGIIPKTRLLFVFYVCLLLSLECGAQNFIGEIGIFPFDFLQGNYNNVGLYCDGSILQIQQYLELFSLIGTTYGGDGVTTFALPDLRGRTPIGMGQGAGLSSYQLGQTGGEFYHTISPSEIPGYTSAAIVSPMSDPSNNSTCTGGTTALAEVDQVCLSEIIQTSVTFTSTGLSTPRENTMKSVPLYFVMFTAGIYPSQSKREAEAEDEKAEEEEEIHEHEVRDNYPSLDQVSIFGFNFAPKGWAFCYGQTLPISTNTAVFSLIGTSFGGDGRTTFQIPDLRGRAVYFSTDTYVGTTLGAETIQLTTDNVFLPSSLSLPAVGSSSPRFCDTTQTAFVARSMCSATTSTKTVSVGSTQTDASPQNNLQPYIALNFGFALQGVFPPRSKRDFTDPFLGEMRLFAGNFAPENWIFAQGQLLSIADNSALFTLFGTTWGGDGFNTFAVPDMQDSIPVGVGQLAGSSRIFYPGVPQGQNTVTLTSANMPAGATYPGKIPTSTARKPLTNSCSTSNAFQINNICSDETTFNMAATAASTNVQAQFDITKPALQLNWIISISGEM